MKALPPLLLIALLSPPAGEEAVRRGWWDADAPAGWVVVEQGELQVQSQAGRLAAERLVAHLDALRPAYAELLPGRPASAPLAVKVFADYDGLAQHDPEGTGGGYFDPAWREVVVWHTGRLLDARDRPAPLGLRGEWRDELSADEHDRVQELLLAVADDRQLDTAGMAAHEGWHAALQECYGQRQLPSWLEEGVGDWFGAARRGDDGRWTRRPMSAARIQRCRDSLQDGSAPGLAELLRVDRETFYADASLSVPFWYAWSELFTRWLLDHPDAGHREFIPRLLARLDHEDDARRATRALLDDDELRAMELAFHAWVAGREPVDPMATLAERWGPRLPARALSGPGDWILGYEQRVEER